MNSALKDIFRKLDSFRAQQKPVGRMGLELRAHKVSVKSLFIAIACLLLLVLLAASQSFDMSSKGAVREFALWLFFGYCICATISVLAMFVEILAVAFNLFARQFDEFIRDVDWDLEQAGQLTCFDRADLKRAQELLELRVRRMQDRIKQFFGSPDKLTFFALIGSAWALSKEWPLILTFDFGRFAWASDWVDIAIWIVPAFVGGLVVGAVLMQQRSLRYNYQIEMIKLNLSARVS